MVLGLKPMRKLITSIAGIGVYYLEDLDEKVVPRPWNVNNLKRYYY